MKVKIFHLHLILWFLIGAITAIPFDVFAQDKVAFIAKANAKQVVQGNAFQIDFELLNGRGRDFRPPSFKDFEIISGPSTSMSTQIINGRTTQQMGYSYTLLAKKTGRFTIGSANIKVGSKTYTTRQVSIEVVKGKKSTANLGSDREVFIRVEPSTTDAYIGQQILVDYKIYTVVDIRNFKALSKPEYDGFFVQEVRGFDSRVGQEVIDGVQYTTRVVDRVSLFPQQAGILTIEPMLMQLGIEIPGQKPSRGFFSRTPTRPANVKTEPIEISVRPFPDGAPPSFAGAVGTFVMRTSVTPKVLTTDDALTVRMIIQGDGDAKRLQAPTLILPKEFEVFDPTVIDEDERGNRGSVQNSKVFEWLVVPKKKGSYILQPAFTYFDPEKNEYITLNGTATTVNIKQGTGATNRSIDDSAIPKKDIRFIKLETELSRPKPPFFNSGMFWLLTLLPIIGVLLFLIFRLAKNSSGNIDTTVFRQQQAGKIALQQFETAKKHLQNKDR